MLVLSRKLGEKVMIGDDVVITVVDIVRGKIRLGIEAPKEIEIMREEMLASDDPRRSGPKRGGTTPQAG